ncbi:MAG: aminodeoxychorismate synthase component I, partial [Pseudoxanthomonas sp.]
MTMIETRALSPDTDLLALHRRDPARYPVLLESVASGTVQGRWDLLLMAEAGEGFALHHDGRVRDLRGAQRDTGFLDTLDAHWQAARIDREEPRWPFRGGWALLLSYELAGQVEPVLALPDAPGALPLALALRCPAAVLRDRASGECCIVAEAEAADMLERIEADVAAALRLPLPEWQAPDSIDEDPPAR